MIKQARNQQILFLLLTELENARSSLRTRNVLVKSPHHQDRVLAPVQSLPPSHLIEAVPTDIVSPIELAIEGFRLACRPQSVAEGTNPALTLMPDHQWCIDSGKNPFSGY